MKLILVRGLPGSGKSTFANSLCLRVVEADQYFVNTAGIYTFDPTQLPEAHLWCAREAFTWLKWEHDVVVANTFTQRWEFKRYEVMAELMGVELVVYKCVGNFQNVHGVPAEAIQRMKDRWEDYPNEIEVPIG